MKRLIALVALFTFLAVCSWYTVSEGFLGAGDSFNAGISQAQEGEQQHQDLATSEAESLNPFPNERTQTNYDCQSVGTSEVWYNHAFLQRHEGNIWHQAYPYRPGLLRESREGRHAFITINWYRPANRLTL